MSPASKFPRYALAALILLPMLGFLPSVLGRRVRLPLDRRPTWAQLVVVTCERFPAERDTPGLAELERRAARAALEPVTDPRAAAASLWTGRHHPADGPGPLEGGTWTVAEAARRSGAATAAWLQTPLATELALAGFDMRIEDPDLDNEAIAGRLDDLLAAHAEGRVAVWIHLDDASDLDSLLTRLHAALDARGHRWDTLLVATALAGDGPIPLFAELPSALHADRAGRGTARHADLAAVLLQLLRYPGPDATRGELPVEARPTLVTLLQGGTVD